MQGIEDKFSPAVMKSKRLSMFYNRLQLDPILGLAAEEDI
jgi:hypothetical protein